MLKRYAAILLFLFAMCFAHGQHHDGTYSFLDTYDSPRLAALGGSLLSIDDHDLQIAFVNPSLIDSAMHNDVVLSYVKNFSDINNATIQYARHLNKLGNFAAVVQYHNYGTFNYANADGTLSGGTFTASDYVVGVGWGRRLTPHLSIGANVKLFGTQYEKRRSIGVGVDVAGSYRTTQGWMWSLAARNIGMELHGNYDGSRQNIPFHLQAAVAKRLEHVPFLFSLTYSDIQKWDLRYEDPIDLLNENDAMTGEKKEKSDLSKFGENLMRHLIIGGEIYIGKNITLRASYCYDRRQNMKMPGKKGMAGFSYGLSVHVWKLDISYSRAEYHAVGAPNFFSISTNFDRFSKN